MRSRFTAIAAAVAVALTFSTAQAATVGVSTIESITKVTTIKPLTKTVESPISFKQVDPLSIGEGSPFILGTLFHNGGKMKKKGNNYVAELAMSINGDAGGTPFVLDLLYKFSLNGGILDGNPCTLGKKKCNAMIGITPILNGPLVVRSGDLIYTIIVDGFVEELGAPIVRQFLTPKRGVGTDFFLQARYTVERVEDPAPIPLPAGALLLGAALAGLGLARRKRA
jgi:hypothetical protein